MKNLAIFLFFCFLLLLIPSTFAQVPEWSNNITSIFFDDCPIEISEFSVIWIEASNVYFETNQSGSAQNYSFSTNSSNTFSFSQNFKNGAYYWKSYGINGTNENATDKLQFTINPSNSTDYYYFCDRLYSVQNISECINGAKQPDILNYFNCSFGCSNDTLKYEEGFGWHKCKPHQFYTNLQILYLILGGLIVLGLIGFLWKKILR